MTATVERIESWIVDVPTIRPHKLSMTCFPFDYETYLTQSDSR